MINAHMKSSKKIIGFITIDESSTTYFKFANLNS